MSSRDDPRIPIRLGPAGSALADSHVLVTDDLERSGGRGSGHIFACACCVPRGVLARSLSHLFLARVRGEVDYFREVLLVTDQDRAALAEELTSDVLTNARYRLA